MAVGCMDAARNELALRLEVSLPGGSRASEVFGNFRQAMSRLDCWLRLSVQYENV